MMKLSNLCPQRSLAAFVLTGLLVCTGVAAMAQTTGAGSINGTVMDPNGAVVPSRDGHGSRR